MPKDPKDNLEKVTKEIVKSLRKGAGRVPIEPSALKRYDREYLGFVRQMVEESPPRWDKARTNLLNAVEQHGVIAAAIARLRRPTQAKGRMIIDWSVLSDAGNLVKGECQLNFGDGAWCA